MELIEIRDGVMTFHYAGNYHLIEDKGPVSNIRVKSRQATITDCPCFLRPGIDVCVLLPPQTGGNSEVKTLWSH